MPRMRTVLLTTVLAALLLAVWMSLHGCGRDADAETGSGLRQELVRERQRREAAEFESRRWQSRAMRLAGAAVLALVAGAALGSRARRSVRRDHPHDTAM